MTQCDRTVWNVPLESELIFGVFHVLRLEFDDFVIKDHSVDVADQEALVELQLWGYEETSFD